MGYTPPPNEAAAKVWANIDNPQNWVRNMYTCSITGYTPSTLVVWASKVPPASQLS